MIASCCGKSREFYFHNDAAIAKTSMSKIELHPQQILRMMTQLQSASVISKQTGGLHNAAISDGNTFLNIDKILDVIMHLISYMVIVYKDIFR